MKMTTMTLKTHAKRKRARNAKPKRAKKKDAKRKNARRTKVRRKVIFWHTMKMQITQQLPHPQSGVANVRM